jgi:hypothetical protein
MAVDVRLGDGQYRLFWPRDLWEIPPQTWWRYLLGGKAAGYLRLLFTEMRGRSILRTSGVRSSRKSARAVIVPGGGLSALSSQAPYLIGDGGYGLYLV